MKIGVVGSEGVVGGACKFGFELLGHDVRTHDIILNTTMDNVVGSEIVFICVPTPSNEDGACDISIVNDVVRELKRL